MTVVIIRCKEENREVCVEFRRFARRYRNYAVALRVLLERAGVWGGRGEKIPLA